MLFSIRSECNHAPKIGSPMGEFNESVFSYKNLYPLARIFQNYGYTFLIDESNFLFVAFRGARARRPVVCQYFDSLNALKTFYYSFVDKLFDAADCKRARSIRAVKRNKRDIQPGSIFYTSCGRYSVDIEFFQIIAVKGRMVTIQKIRTVITYQTIDSGWACAVKDSFLDSPIRLRIGSHGMRIDAIRYLHRWDKKALFWCE